VRIRRFHRDDVLDTDNTVGAASGFPEVSPKLHERSRVHDNRVRDKLGLQPTVF